MQNRSVEISVIAPAHNEEGNVRQLVDEIRSAMAGRGRGFEIVIVDDGSTDRTQSLLLEQVHSCPELRIIQMLRTPPGRGNGQSAAFHAAFRACRGEIIAMLDADLQNDPADIPRLLDVMESHNADLVQGDRSANRRDNWTRKLGWIVGVVFRRVLLGDTIRDTGCSLRVIRREVALALPLEFRGMHRYIPVTARRLGFKVIEVPVNHRPRTSGRAKYGMWNRAIPGIFDCLAVRWMLRRRRPTTFRELKADSPAETGLPHAPKPERVS